MELEWQDFLKKIAASFKKRDQYKRLLEVSLHALDKMPDQEIVKYNTTTRILAHDIHDAINGGTK